MQSSHKRTVEPVQISSYAKGACVNLLAENPQLQERRFEKIFCYQVDEPVTLPGLPQ